MTVKQRERCVPTDQEILDTALALAWCLGFGPRQFVDSAPLFEHVIAVLMAWVAATKRERDQMAKRVDCRQSDIGTETIAWCRGIDGREKTWAETDSTFRKSRLLMAHYQQNPEAN